MDNLNYEIQALNKEILALKTERQKKIDKLTTIEYKIPVTFELEAYQASETVRRIQSKERVEIVVSPQLDRGYFTSARIDITDTDDRVLLWNDTGAGSSVSRIYGLRIFNSTNSDDVSKIDSGQTPVVNYTVIITSTTPLNINVR